MEVKEGEIYRHFKGPFYYVICVGLDSETRERVVVYRHLDNSGIICTRPEKMFLEEFLRENPDIVKENIKKKFQMHKLELVDEVLDLDNKNRELKLKGDELRMKRNSLSSQIGGLMQSGKKDEAEKVKLEVKAINDELANNEKLEAEYSEKVTAIMMKIPNIMHESVPVRKR